MEEMVGKAEIITDTTRKTTRFNNISKNNWKKEVSSINENSETSETPSRKSAWNNYFKIRLYVQKIDDNQ